MLERLIDEIINICGACREEGIKTPKIKHKTFIYRGARDTQRGMRNTTGQGFTGDILRYWLQIRRDP